MAPIEPERVQMGIDEGGDHRLGQERPATPAPLRRPRRSRGTAHDVCWLSIGEAVEIAADADRVLEVEDEAHGPDLGRLSPLGGRYVVDAHHYDGRVIFDAHMHVGEFPLFDVRLDRDGLVALMDQHDYDGCVVFHPDNALVEGILQTVPDAWGLVWANPRMPDGVEEAIRYLDHPRFVGVKLHPLFDGYHPDDPIVHPIYEAAIARDVPLLIHCGHPIFTLPWSIEEAAVRFPRAKVILGHMGHGNIVYIDGAIAVAERNENVWLETSGMPMHTKIAEAVRRVGAERVMYGSDAPFHHPVVEMAKVRVSGLPDDLIERVLGDNAGELFLGRRTGRG